MTPSQRVYYLSVCALCMALCVVIQVTLPFMSWQWWLLNLTFAHAGQPFINLAKAGIGRLWATRRVAPRRYVYDLIDVSGKNV